MVLCYTADLTGLSNVNSLVDGGAKYVLCRAQATLQLAEMARLGVQPDSIAATALVNACVRNRKMDMALSVFDELFGEPLTLSH